MKRCNLPRRRNQSAPVPSTCRTFGSNDEPMLDKTAQSNVAPDRKTKSRDIKLRKRCRVQMSIVVAGLYVNK